MKTRIVVYIALNAKGERLRILVDAHGRIVSYPGKFFEDIKYLVNCGFSDWLSPELITQKSVSKWKFESKLRGAVRFQRVTLIGETK